MSEENVTLILFNPTMDKTNDINQIKEEFQGTNHSIDLNSCIADIKSKKTNITFLIIAENNAHELLSTFAKISQLHSIFIFSENPENLDHLYNVYPTLVDVFDNVENLIKSIKESIKGVYKQRQIISFYDEHQQSSFDISKQLPEFLW